MTPTTESIRLWENILAGMRLANRAVPYGPTHRMVAMALDAYFARLEAAIDPRLITGPEEPKRGSK